MVTTRKRVKAASLSTSYHANALDTASGGATALSEGEKLSWLPERRSDSEGPLVKWYAKCETHGSKCSTTACPSSAWFLSAPCLSDERLPDNERLAATFYADTWDRVFGCLPGHYLILASACCAWRARYERLAAHPHISAQRTVYSAVTSVQQAEWALALGRSDDSARGRESWQVLHRQLTDHALRRGDLPAVKRLHALRRLTDVRLALPVNTRKKSHNFTGSSR
ncbi:hypothetical protein JKP88DRAFT_254429 [Tribonema minus]|uniref:Uncharacterized protein n=1 Tax=Tribonema minus TaxID=303371 RepID=A0A836CKE1_9STRA|nr:hypothetical protein JKP88DRAFT_254429 [Tribonema minus]